MPDTDFKTLAIRLVDHADKIVDPRQQALEQDLRTAAVTIASIDMALVPRLTNVLRGAAQHCSDVAVRELLYGLVGDRA